MGASLEIENPMLLERRYHRFDDPIEWVPTVRCQCGCDEIIDVVELRTHEGEPVATEACFLRIAYKEKWLIKEAV